MEGHRTFALLLLAMSALTLTVSASPVMCTPVLIDGSKKGCVINDELKEDAFEKRGDLFDVDDSEAEKTWTKIILQDGGEPCSTSSNKPLDEQRLATTRSRGLKTSNVPSPLSKSQLDFVKRVSLMRGLGSDQMRELVQDAGKRSTHEISAILPPWKEFCRMLGRNGCGRYMRRQLSR